MSLYKYVAVVGGATIVGITGYIGLLYNKKNILKIDKKMFDIEIVKLSKDDNDELHRMIPDLDKLIKEYNGDIVVGGSSALKLYTKHDFEVDDTDIFLRSKEYRLNLMETYLEGDDISKWTYKNDDRKVYVDKDVNLKLDYNFLKTLYPKLEIRKKLAREIKNKSVVSGEDGNENFDESIFGTLNIISPTHGKLQYVIVNNITDKLYEWYKDTTDLPVFILYDNESREFMWYKKSKYLAECAENKILVEKYFGHKYRIDKYKEKGFNFIKNVDDYEMFKYI